MEAANTNLEDTNTQMEALVMEAHRQQETAASARAANDRVAALEVELQENRSQLQSLQVGFHHMALPP